MNTPKTILPCVLSVAILLSSCDALRDRPGETLGALVGTGVGAILGSEIGNGTGQSIATLFGAAVGAWAGSTLGRKLDEHDWELAEATAQDTLENGDTGTNKTWSNPDSGNSGSIRPTSDRVAESDNGQECREFESTIVVDGETEVATGRACRQPDGSWLIIQ